MTKENNAKKSALLGMPVGTAFNRLRKSVMFSLICKTGQDTCFRCGKQIATAEELSIEHKDSWQRSADPRGTFFDIENIAFSHLSCNVAAAHRPTKKYFSAEERSAAAKEASKRNYDKNGRVWEANRQRRRALDFINSRRRYDHSGLV